MLKVVLRNSVGDLDSRLVEASCDVPFAIAELISSVPEMYGGDSIVVFELDDEEKPNG